MKLLYAPWRALYSKKMDTAEKQERATAAECVFCKQLQEQRDEENLILKRFEHVYVALNKFPYNAGHLLVLPIAHHGQLSDMTEAARAQLIEVTTKSIQIITSIIKAEGINVGLNLGIAAGAGIPSHLHMHIVPRWARDTNFMPVIADTKIVSFDLHEMYKKLKAGFDAR